MMDEREKNDILLRIEARRIASKVLNEERRARLRGSVVRFDRPLDPVIESEGWEMDRRFCEPVGREPMNWLDRFAVR